PSGTQALAEALKTNSTLTTLCLQSNSIGDKGAQALTESLLTNSTLTTLDLRHNSIGPSGAQALAEALKTNLTLTLLNLSNNTMGPNGTQALPITTMVKSSFAFLAAVASVAIFFSSPSSVESIPVHLKTRGTSGQIGALISESEYCLFLPKNKNGNVAESEDDAVAFCSQDISSAPGAQTLPDGFVASTHFVTNEEHGWVQLTGRLNTEVYLAKDDEGGQYDTRAPIGASYAGYVAFVQITEPDSGIYCIRACKKKSDCPVNRSTYGCVEVLGGDYS
ncbi:hypothetical protein BGZ83_008494, partial [Gryganskiella cystojenkinii]